MLCTFFFAIFDDFVGSISQMLRFYSYKYIPKIIVFIRFQSILNIISQLRLPLKWPCIRIYTSQDELMSWCCQKVSWWISRIAVLNSNLYRNPLKLECRRIYSRQYVHWNFKPAQTTTNNVEHKQDRLNWFQFMLLCTWPSKASSFLTSTKLW